MSRTIEEISEEIMKKAGRPCSMQDKLIEIIEAMHDCINRPKGVVPKSAEEYYHHNYYTVLNNTTTMLDSQEHAKTVTKGGFKP